MHELTPRPSSLRFTRQCREIEWEAIENELREEGAAADLIRRREINYWLRAATEDNTVYEGHHLPPMTRCGAHDTLYFGICADCVLGKPDVEFADPHTDAARAVVENARRADAWRQKREEKARAEASRLVETLSRPRGLQLFWWQLGQGNLGAWFLAGVLIALVVSLIIRL